MSFSFFEGASPQRRWSDVLAPMQQKAISQLDEIKAQNQQRQTNIQEGTTLANLMREIKSLGPNAQMEDIVASIAGAQQRGLPRDQATYQQERYGKMEQQKSKEANAPVKESQFEKSLSIQDAKEFSALPEKINEYQELLTDLKRAQELTEESNYRGANLNRGINNEWKAILSKLAVKKASLLKGNQSDKDMALLLEQFGDLGDIGGKKIFDRLIKQAENGLGIYNTQANRIQKKYGDIGKINRGEGAQTPGEPEGLRAQQEKPQGRKIHARNKKTNKQYIFPEENFPKNDPDLEIINL